MAEVPAAPAPAPVPEPAAPPPRKSWLALILVIVAIGGSAIGVTIYQMLQSGQKTPVDNSGFDIAQTTEKNPSVTTESGQPQQPQSSLMGVTGMNGVHFGNMTGSSSGSGQQNGAGGSAQAAAPFTELARKYEPGVTRFVNQYAGRSAVLQNYAKDWFAYPDLKKLNDDYARNHDPVAFMHGLAQSPNFPTLVKKYAGQPAMQQFAKDAMHAAPSELTQAAMNFVSGDNIVKTLCGNVMSSLGLPPIFGGDAPKIDAGTVMGSMMNNNPQMQKAMEANPDIQKQINNATHSGQH